MSISRAANLRCLGMKREKGSRRPSWRGTLKSGSEICFTGSFDDVSSAKRLTISTAFCCRVSGCKFIEKSLHAKISFTIESALTKKRSSFEALSLLFSLYLWTFAHRKEINFVSRTVFLRKFTFEKQGQRELDLRKESFTLWNFIRNLTFSERRALLSKV